MEYLMERHIGECLSGYLSKYHFERPSESDYQSALSSNYQSTLSSNYQNALSSNYQSNLLKRLIGEAPPGVAGEFLLGCLLEPLTDAFIILMPIADLQM